MGVAAAALGAFDDAPCLEETDVSAEADGSVAVRGAGDGGEGLCASRRTTGGEGVSMAAGDRGRACERGG